MSSSSQSIEQKKSFFNLRWAIGRLLDLLSVPILALLSAFIIGGLIIWLTSGDITNVFAAYSGLIDGALFKQRGLSESLVATVPYVLLSLGLAVGFRSGLFNIGVEGQFTIGALAAAWMGQISNSLPAIIHLPLTLLAGFVGGAIWAGIPGLLKAKTGAHEVISTMMMNYIAFRLLEYVIQDVFRDRLATAPQTPRISANAELWSMASIPQRLQDPLNALMVALVIGVIMAIIARVIFRRPGLSKRLDSEIKMRSAYIGVGIFFGLLSFLALPPLTQLWWPFTDQFDRLHIGIFLALFAAILVWWFLFKTTPGFELRMVGANANAAKYAGVNLTRNIMIAMTLSGGLAGLAGTGEVLGVSICRCLPMFFSQGYGFDSIAITLLAKNSPFGILISSFLFGAMRNGADLMELRSGVSKDIISVIQALVLLFVAAPVIVRWIYRLKGARRAADEDTITMKGWGG